MNDTELRDRMLEIVRRTRLEIEGEAARVKLPPVALRPHDPAPPGLIETFERYVRTALPPSYRAFLSLHNGYDGLAYGGDMLPLESLLPGGASHERINKWKRLSADYGSLEVLDGIVIASSRQPNQWLYIDPNRRAPHGELAFVLWMGDTTETFDDLFGFFQFVIDTCRFDLDSAA